MEIIDVRRNPVSASAPLESTGKEGNILYFIAVEFHFTGKPLKFATERISNISPWPRYDALRSYFWRDNKDFSFSTSLDAVVQTNNTLSQDPCPSINNGEERRMYQIKHSFVGARVPVTTVNWYILERHNSDTECILQGGRDSTVRFNDIAIVCSDSARFLEQSGLVSKLADAIREHTLCHVKIGFRECFHFPFCHYCFVEDLCTAHRHMLPMLWIYVKLLYLFIPIRLVSYCIHETHHFKLAQGCKSPSVRLVSFKCLSMLRGGNLHIFSFQCDREKGTPFI